MATIARPMSTTACVDLDEQLRYEFVVLTGRCSLSPARKQRSRFGLVVRPSGGLNSPTKQSVRVGGGRVARLFCQRGGALEGLVGPCEAGVHTGGGQDQGKTAVQLRQQHGRRGMTTASMGMGGVA